MFCIFNEKERCPAYISKVNSNCEKSLMITNKEKKVWYYVAMKNYQHY